MAARPSLRWLAAILAGLCAAPRLARADGIAAQAQGGYSNSTTTTTDETGLRTRTDGDSWTQRYRLSLDETLFPLVRFGASGLLDWLTSSSRVGGVRTDSDTKTWDGNAHLTFGSPVLSGGLDYDRREQSAELRTGGVSTAPPTLVRDTYSGSLGWHPLDLPTLDLRLSRVESYDSPRTTTDLTTNEAQLSSRFDPTSTTEVRYAARYADVTNHIGGVRTTEVGNSLAATWSDRFLEGRGSAYVGYAVNARTTETSVQSATGTVTTQRIPIAGLSIVEGSLDIPGRVTLNPNTALIDGVTTASAGVNLGFSAGSGLVVTSRDLGAQLPNAVTQVSVVHVYVDRNAAPVASQFVWDAYRSDDNLEWTRVGVAGVVSFDPLLSRFEIPIPPTTARYVKVVTKPIARQLTTDPQFSDIFVTELQLFDVAQAADVRGRTNTLSGTLNGTGRILLLRAPSLSYDASLVVTHSNQPALVTYAVVNGLSLQHRLARTVTGAARVDRSDSDAGRGHEALNRWSGSLALDPLPTLGGTLAYTGQLAQHPTGHAISHNGTAVARADLYEGISSSASASAGWSNDDKGRTSRGTTAAVGFSIVPNPVLSTTWNASYTSSTQTGAGLPEQSDWRGILEATASLSPFRSLALAGNVVRLFGKSGASTLVNFNGGLALFPGGDLQLSYAYQESLDSSAQSRTRTHGPGLRWNIRPGWILTSAYTFQHNSTPSQTLDGQAFSVNLVITLR